MADVKEKVYMSRHGNFQLMVGEQKWEIGEDGIRREVRRQHCHFKNRMFQTSDPALIKLIEAAPGFNSDFYDLTAHNDVRRKQLERELRSLGGGPVVHEGTIGTKNVAMTQELLAKEKEIEELKAALAKAEAHKTGVRSGK